MKRISKLALITIIIQTIVTFGINWLYFIVFYRVRKASLLSTNKENFYINGIKIYFTKDIRKLSLFSIIAFFLYLILFSLLIMLVLDPNFFMIINNELFKYIFDNLGVAVLLSIVFFFIIYYLNKIIISKVIHTIYKNNHDCFCNYSDSDKMVFILTCIFTLGLVYIFYLFELAITELYLYYLNKYINKQEYKINKVSIIVLLIVLLTSLVLIYYVIRLYYFINPATIYFILVSILNIILNYGLFELLLRMSFDHNIEVFINKYQYRYHFQSNRLVLLIGSIVIIAVLIFTGIRFEKKKDFQIYEISVNNINDYTCHLFGDKEICRLSEEDFDENSSKYRKYQLWQRQYGNSKKHQQLIVSSVNPDKISKQPIVINAKGDVLYTSSEGELISADNNAFLYVQTYYRKINNKYVPIFNIIKNLELIIEFYENSLHLSILNNNVYLYDFQSDTLKKYEENLINIDTTRLMIDDLSIDFNANNNIIYGYQIKEDLTYLNIKTDNVEKLIIALTYFDSFLFDELIYHVRNAYLPFNEESLKYRNEYDLIVFRILSNTKHISYYNDRYYLYMKSINERIRRLNESYIYDENYNLHKCRNDNCNNDKIYTSKQLEIINLSKILYTDAYVDPYDTFTVNDKKEIRLLLEDRKNFTGDINISFSIKTIKQYFTKESMLDELSIQLKRK